MAISHLKGTDNTGIPIIAALGTGFSIVDGVISATGDAGSPALLTTSIYQASTSISALRAVKLNSLGLVRYVDPSTDSNTIGITITSALTGENPTIALSGGIIQDGSWSWVIDLPVFVGASGTLTQTPPSSGNAIRVGTAVTATRLLIQIEAAIVL